LNPSTARLMLLRGFFAENSTLEEELMMKI
jgi:hypothetical protein